MKSFKSLFIGTLLIAILPALSWGMQEGIDDNDEVLSQADSSRGGDEPLSLNELVEEFQREFLPDIHSMNLEQKKSAIQTILQYLSNHHPQSHRKEIHYAAAFGAIEYMKELIDKSPENIDLKDENGSTPLFYAVTDDTGRAAELLLKSGANPNIETPDKSSLLLLTMNMHNKHMVKLLKEYDTLCSLEIFEEAKKMNKMMKSLRLVYNALVFPNLNSICLVP